jgi:hypothetical protein
MFELSDSDEIITDEVFHSNIDRLLGNITEIISDKDIDPAYFSTPWATVDGMPINVQHDRTD